MKPNVSIKPRIIQRLCEPLMRDGVPFFNPFVFGGGLPNGGLTDEAMQVLGPLFSFDHMGRAEFEDGILAKSYAEIAKMAARGEMTRGETTVSVAEKKFVIYYFCPLKIEGDVCKIIKNLAGKRPAFSLKEPALVYEALCMDYKNLIGWHDVEHHYLFFRSSEPRNGLCDIFEKK